MLQSNNECDILSYYETGRLICYSINYLFEKSSDLIKPVIKFIDKHIKRIDDETILMILASIDDNLMADEKQSVNKDVWLNLRKIVVVERKCREEIGVWTVR